ncbi:hypothetical protein QJS66_23605 (plasmid) [Kocuria rhizophila]|nr:hypothetical protein QJS66_23605 [Kocuria rhizophila]
MTLQWQHSKLELLGEHRTHRPTRASAALPRGALHRHLRTCSSRWKAHEHLIAQAYARPRVCNSPAVLHDFDAAAFHQRRPVSPQTPPPPVLGG